MHTRASVSAQRAKIGNSALKTGLTNFCKFGGLLREFFPTCPKHTQSAAAIFTASSVRGR